MLQCYMCTCVRYPVFNALCYTTRQAPNVHPTDLSMFMFRNQTNNAKYKVNVKKNVSKYDLCYFASWKLL